MTDNFEFLIEPHDAQDFRNRFIDKQAVHLPGKRDKFEGLFSWNALNRVLNASPTPHPTSRAFKDTERAGFIKDAIDIIRLVQTGATYIVDDIDRYDISLGKFLDKLSDEICESTRFNMYASCPGKQGFPLHYDTHDFFILQIEGKKRWKVYPSTIEFPLFHQKSHDAQPPDKTQLYLECLLEKGDVLYVPRGHWHEALAEGEASMHLTLGIFRRTGVDLISWLSDEMRERAEFRKPFPLVFKDENNSKSGLPVEIENHIDNLSRSLQLEMSGQKKLWQRYHSFKTATQKTRQPFSFPFHMEGTVIQPNDFDKLRRNVQSNEIRLRENGSFDLVTSGRVLTFQSKAMPLVKFLFAGELFSMSEIKSHAGDLERDELSGILETLFREGILVAD